MVLFKSGSNTFYNIAVVGFPCSQPVWNTAIFDSCLLHFVVCMQKNAYNKSYVVSISCWDFDILLMSSLTIFGSAGEKALQGHSKLLAILHQGANRAILTRVKYFPCFFHTWVFHGINFPMHRILGITCNFFPFVESLRKISHKFCGKTLTFLTSLKIFEPSSLFSGPR